MPPASPQFRPVFRRSMLVAAVLTLFCASTASAHPLGDFSINQYFIVDGNAPRPTVHFLLDVAEIPSFTELDMLDTDFDSELSQTEVETYLAQRIPQLASFIRLSIDGRNVALAVARHKLVLLEGNGMMVVFNILLSLEADTEWPTEPFTLSLSSENYPDEQGTRECLLLPGTAFIDFTSDLPEASIGGQSKVEQDVVAATIYGNRTASFTLGLSPGSTAGTPLSAEAALDFSWTSTARIAGQQGEPGIAHGIARAVLDSGFRAGAPGATAPPEENPAPSTVKPIVSIAGDVASGTVETGKRPGGDTLTARLVNRVSEIVRQDELPPLWFAIGLAIAMALGMGHAFAPGHGKTVMAAYLVGEQGTSWHALVLGVVVTITHTWSVILLGLVTLYFSHIFSENQVNFWTGIVSGLIIIGIGALLFHRRYNLILADAQGGSGNWGFSHGHDHALEAAPRISLEKGKAPSYASILWLGISGGIVPCPAALIVLLLALKVGRISYGLALLLAFSLGLALVLVVIGLLVVRASQLLQRRNLANHPAFKLLPLASAGLITLLGGWVVVWTLLQFDVLRFG